MPVGYCPVAWCGLWPNGRGSKPMVPFWFVGAPPILEPILVVGLCWIGMFSLRDFDPWPNGTGWEEGCPFPTPPLAKSDAVVAHRFY